MRPQVLATTTVLLSLVLVIVIMQKYEFQDCKKAGNTTTYCLLDIIR